MLFVLINTLAALVDLINMVFSPYLDHFVIFFIDDILVYPKDLKSMHNIKEWFFRSCGSISYIQSGPNLC